MPGYIDLTGRRFGRLTVNEPEPVKTGPHWHWICVCDCGNTLLVLGPSLREGRTKSCGCLHIDAISKHGAFRRGVKSPEYVSWCAMRTRCLNPNNTACKRYGARGITICARWLNSFQKFYEDMGAKPTPKHTIERINPSGNYEPSNCRWATRLEQAQNRENTKYLRHADRVWTTRGLAEHLGTDVDMFRGRVKRGNPISLSVEHPEPIRLTTQSKQA